MTGRLVPTNPLIAFAVAYALFGTSVPFIKMGLESFPALTFAAIKFGLAALILAPWLIKNWRPLPGRMMIRIFLATLTGYVLTVILLYESLKLTSGSSVSLIATLGPLMLFVLSIEFLKEKFNSKILFGLIISALGTALIVLTPVLNQQSGGLSLAGNVLALLSVVSSVIGTILIKPVLGSVKVGSLSAIRMLTAAVILLVLALPELVDFDFTAITLRSYIGLVYGVLISMVLANLLYHYGLGKISVESSSVLHYLDPIFGVIASIVILGEQLSGVLIIGAGLTFWGIYVAEARIHPKFLLLHHNHH